MIVVELNMSSYALDDEDQGSLGPYSNPHELSSAIESVMTCAIIYEHPNLDLSVHSIMTH